MASVQTQPSRDPYRAPTAAVNLTPPPLVAAGAFAARLSLVLAIAGLVLFWGVTVMVRVMPWEYKPTGLAMSLALFIAAALHLAGIGAAWAAARGKRMLGLLANTVALLALAALIAILAAG